MRHHTCVSLCAVIVLCLSASLYAQEKKDAAPAPAPEKASTSTVTIVEMKGGVEVRSGADKPWGPATVGMKLWPDWEISTGLRGQAVLHFEDNSEVVVQRLTEMKISEFAKTQGTVKTQLNMKYGAVRVQVKRGTAENDFKVASPTATASVKGTKIQEFSYYRGFGTQIRMGDEGHAEYHVNPTIMLGPGEWTDDNLSFPILFAKMHTWVSVNFPGYTSEEFNSSLWHGTQFESTWESLRGSNPSNTNLFTQSLPPPPPPPPPTPPPSQGTQSPPGGPPVPPFGGPPPRHPIPW